MNAESLCSECDEAIPLGEAESCSSCGGLFCGRCVRPGKHSQCSSEAAADDDGDAYDDELELS